MTQPTPSPLTSWPLVEDVLTRWMAEKVAWGRWTGPPAEYLFFTGDGRRTPSRRSGGLGGPGIGSLESPYEE